MFYQEKREEANKSGKNADDCLDIITNKVNNAYQKEYSNLNQCKNQAIQSIEAELQVLDAQEIVCTILLFIENYLYKNSYKSIYKMNII